MTKRPPPTAGARIIGVVIAPLIVIFAVVVVNVFTPFFMLSPFDPEDRLPLAGLLLLFSLVGVLAYRFATRLAGRLVLKGRPTPRATVPSELVTAYLREVDFPCTVCNYNLRGLQQPVCPECSTPVRLAMVSADASVVGERFALTLVWLVVALACSGLVGMVTVRWLFALVESMGPAGGGGGGGGGGGPGLSLWTVAVVAYAFVPVLSGGACLLRLVMLFFARGEKRARWTRSTVMTLGIIGSVWMVALALLTVPLMLFLI